MKQVDEKKSAWDELTTLITKAGARDDDFPGSHFDGAKAEFREVDEDGGAGRGPRTAALIRLRKAGEEFRVATPAPVSGRTAEDNSYQEFIPKEFIPRKFAWAPVFFWGRLGVFL